MNAFTSIILCLGAAISGGDSNGNGGNGGDKNGNQTIDVRVRVGATVRGTDVQIGELCEITPINRDTLAMAKLVFANSPASGRARTVTRTEIIQSLVANGQDVSKFSFSGPTEIVIQPVRVEVPAADILDTAMAAVRALLALEGGDVEIEVPTRMRRLEAPPGRMSSELIARVRGGRTGPTSAVVDVDVMVDGAQFKRFPVQFKLQRYQLILKTGGVIRAGTTLGPHNLLIAREPLAQATGLYLTKFEDVVDMIAARNLQANSRITLGDTAPPSVIRKGEVVTVVLTRGRVKVTAKAIANHDAPMGARITLTNMRSRSTLIGVVAAPGLAVIHN